MKIWTSERRKALAEIYTMHSFAPFWNRIPKTRKTMEGKRAWSNPGKTGQEELIGSRKLLPSTTTGARGLSSFFNIKISTKNRQHFFANEKWQILLRFSNKKLSLEDSARTHENGSPHGFPGFWDSIPKRCRGVHFVDLGESFPTHIYLQNLASIQPRTSPSKLDS